MDIHALMFDYDYKHPLFADDESALLMDLLPQSGIGSFFIRTDEMGVKNPTLTFLLLFDEDIERLKDWDEEPALQKAIEKIVEYAAANPKDEYFFVVTC